MYPEFHTFFKIFSKVADIPETYWSIESFYDSKNAAEFDTHKEQYFIDLPFQCSCRPLWENKLQATFPCKSSVPFTGEMNSQNPSLA